MVDIKEVCQMCRAVGKHSKVKVFQINLKEAVKLCEDDACTYPIGLDNIIQRRLDEVVVPPKRRQSSKQLALNHPVPRLQPPSLSSQAPLNVIRPQPVTPHPEPSKLVPLIPGFESFEQSPRLNSWPLKQGVNRFTSPNVSTRVTVNKEGFLPVQPVVTKPANKQASINTLTSGTIALKREDQPFTNNENGFVPVQPSVTNSVKPAPNILPSVTVAPKGENHSRISPEQAVSAISVLKSIPEKSVSSLSSTHCVQAIPAPLSELQQPNAGKNSTLKLKTDDKLTSSSPVPLSTDEFQETLQSLENEMDIDTSEVTEVIDIHLSLDDLKEGMPNNQTNEQTSERRNVSPISDTLPPKLGNLTLSPFIPIRSNQGVVKGDVTSSSHVKPMGENNDCDNVISQEVEIETSSADDSLTLGDDATYFVVEMSKRKRKPKTDEFKKEKSNEKHKSDNQKSGNKHEVSKIQNEVDDVKTDGKDSIHKALPSLDVFKFFPQWQNEEALCWLDVVLCLFVHSRTIRELECDGADLSKTVLVTLYKAYHQACQLVNKYREKTVKHQLEAASRTRSGRLFSDPDDSDSDALVESPSTELLKDMGRVNPNAIKTGAGLNCSKDFLSMLNTDEQANYREAFTMLKDVRESIWNRVQPRLQCVKGKNDSPVLAIPLLVKDNILIEKKFAVSYDFQFSCSACGYKQVDRDRKVLPTFPSTVETFTMKEPAFLRSCFRCNAPDQKRIMKFNKLPGVLLLHFAEGLSHNNFKKLEFWHNGLKYTVTGFVQYRNDPDHFVTWIRKSKDSRWIEFDDLKSPICRFESRQPEVDASQIHIVMWESCKQVDSEKERIPCVDAKNVQVVSPNGASIRGDQILAENVGEHQWAESLKKAVQVITENKPLVKPHSVSIATDTVDIDNHETNVLKTISQNSQVNCRSRDSQCEIDEKDILHRREALAKLWKPKPSAVTKINAVKEKRLKKTVSLVKYKEKVSKKAKKLDMGKDSSCQTLQDVHETKNNHNKNEWKPVNKLKFHEQKYCGLLTNGSNYPESSNVKTLTPYAWKCSKKSLESVNKTTASNSYANTNGMTKTETEESLMRSNVSAGTSTDDCTVTKKAKNVVCVNSTDIRKGKKDCKKPEDSSNRHLHIGNGKTDKAFCPITSTRSKYLTPLSGSEYNPMDETYNSTAKSKRRAKLGDKDETGSIISSCSSRSSSVAQQFSVASKPFSGFRSKTFSGYQSGSNLNSRTSSASSEMSTNNGWSASKRKSSINNLITVKRLKPQCSLLGTPYTSGFNTPYNGSSARSSPVLPRRGMEGDILKDLYNALDLLPPEKEGSLDLSAIEGESSGVCMQTMDDFLDQIL